jgi:hypothetical protein
MNEYGTPGPYAVICDGEFCNGAQGKRRVFLTKEQYDKQMMRPDSTWRCPHCGEEAIWDDDNYEKYLDTVNEEEMGEEYTCASCHKTFISERTEEDAIAEKERLFGDVPLSQCDVVCSDCFKKMNAQFKWTEDI